MATFTTSAQPAVTESLPQLLERARALVARYAETPSDVVIWRELAQLRRQAAVQTGCLPARVHESPDVDAVIDLLHVFAASGANDYTVDTDDHTLAQGYRKQGWPGLLASMLLLPAWQWPDAPRYDDVSNWLWADYTAYLFYTPQGFTSVGQGKAYAAHYLRRLEELAQWASSNPGSATVRAAIDVFVGTANSIPLYFDEGSLRRHMEFRGRIFTIATGATRQDDIFPMPRLGRRLRVGFVNRHFGPQTETYTTIPSFEQLDPERFEVLLFSIHSGGSAIENHAREHASSFRQLPPSLPEQLALLRSEALDVVVFGTNLTAVFNEITALALHRVAPLQVVNNSSCTTSGLPHVDLYVSGSLTETAEAQAHFSERLGLLPGPAHAFNYEADAQEPTTSWTRASLNIPEDALVFATAANYFKIIPEIQHAWVKLLAAVPGSYLLIHPFNPNWSSSYPIKRFCAEIDRVMQEHGVSGDRLIISTEKFPSRSDVRELLALGDIYLDSFPFGGVNSLVDPLSKNIPVVTWEGSCFRSRMGAALLRSLGLDELIAKDAASYHALVTRLATDAKTRTALRETIEANMARLPIFLDTLAASEAFGALLETAYDELELNGRALFRSTQTPLRAPSPEKPDRILADAEARLNAGLYPEAGDLARSILAADPASPQARHLLGRCHMEQAHFARAVTYLLAAVQHEEHNPLLWHNLARALAHANRKVESLQALEASLRLDAKSVEAWLMLGDIAHTLGHTEMVQDVSNVLQELAPGDPRTLAFQGQIDSHL